MKVFIKSLIVLLIFSCRPSSDNTENDRDTTRMLTEVFTNTYSVKEENGNLVKDTINMIQSVIIDQEGKELENLYYNLDGTVSWRDVYRFNDAGFKIGSQYYEGEKQISYYEYDCLLYTSPSPRDS